MAYPALPPGEAARRKRLRNAAHARTPKAKATRKRWQDARRETLDIQIEVQRKRRLYGLEPEQFDTLMQEQQGLCAICRIRPAACVDHCHKTGAVRGLLCRPCNTGIGQLQDDPALVALALAYLRRF